MRIITQRDLVMTVAERWRSSNRASESVGCRDWMKREIQAGLDALDLGKATAAEVDRIIGNRTWTRLTCVECDGDGGTEWVMFGEEDLQDDVAIVCRSCAKRAARLLARAKRDGARRRG